MKNLKYLIYREGEYYVSQCLNVEVASFGTTIEEALVNLKEAVELYLEETLQQRLLDIAQQRNLSFSEMVNDLIKKELAIEGL